MSLENAMAPLGLSLFVSTKSFWLFFLIHSVTVLDLSLQGGGYDKRKAIVESCSILWDPGLVMCRCHKKAHKHNIQTREMTKQKKLFRFRFLQFWVLYKLIRPSHRLLTKRQLLFFSQPSVLNWLSPAKPLGILKVKIPEIFERTIVVGSQHGKNKN